MKSTGDGASGHVCFLACGSRGDVQPVLSLAISLKQARGKAVRITFATHEELLPLVRRLVELHLPPPSSSTTRTTRFAIKGIRSNVFRRRVLPSDVEGSAEREEKQGSPRTGQQQQSEVAVGPESRVGEREQLTRYREIIDCLEASRGAHLLVFNLFCLDGYHIAEHLSIPCIGVNGYLLPSCMPSRLKAELRRDFPDLFEKLHCSSSRASSTSSPLNTPSSLSDSKEAGRGLSSEAAALKMGGENDTVGFREIEEWM
eukprot:jgi/Bigna1/136364/aug1.33_g11072